MGKIAFQVNKTETYWAGFLVDAGCVKSRRLPFIALVGVHGYYCWSIRNNWVDLAKTNHRDL
jgi:hypothetical protein